jgi:hypothetical protein
MEAGKCNLNPGKVAVTAECKTDDLGEMAHVAIPAI